MRFVKSQQSGRGASDGENAKKCDEEIAHKAPGDGSPKTLPAANGAADTDDATKLPLASTRKQIRFTIGTAGLLLVAVPVLFELMFVGILSYLLQQSEEETQRQLRSKTIIAKANLVMKRAAGVTMSAGGYTFSRDEMYSQEYETLLELIMVDLDDLDKMVQDKPTQHEHLNKMREIMEKLRGRLKRFKTLINQTSSGDFMTLLASTKGLQNARALIQSMGLEMDQFIDAERSVERTSPEVSQANQRRIYWTLWGSVAASILLAMLLAKFFAGSISSRVAVLTDNTMRLSRGQSLNPLIEGTDELAHLDGVFHEVVDHMNELNRQKQELVALVSHELKSPLTSVSGLLSLLEAGAFGDLSDRGLHQIAGAEMDLARLMRLINDLLDIEKLEAGKLEMLCKDVLLSRVIKGALMSVQSFADVHEIRIETPPTSVSVHADEDRLIQVMVNFLSNAIKYSDDGQTILVSVLQSGDQVEVQVRDSGRGIPPQFRESVFERYTQVRREDATVKGGSGLGLHVCKRIIEQLGGTIGVDSEEGKGSSFWIRLPAGRTTSISE